MPTSERVAGQRWGTVAPPVLAAVAVAVQVLVPGGWGGAAWVLLAVGVAAGLPHGAVDHLVPGWRPGRGPTGVVVVATAYAVLAAATYAALRAAPRAGLLIFLALSAAHFAAADASWWRRTGATATGTTGARLLPAAAAGVVPVVVPVVCRPGAALPLLDRIAPGTGALVGTDVRLVAGLAVAALVLAAVAAGGRRPAAEVLVLVVLFVVVPPAAAFGVYFGGWHSLRHTFRLLDTDPATRTSARNGQLRRAFAALARQAALPVALALAGLAALAAAVGVRPALFLILAALTVPHLVIVGLLDARDRCTYGAGERMAPGRVVS